MVLGPANGAGPLPNTCTIDFTFDVLQRPLDGDTTAQAVVDAITAGVAIPVLNQGVSPIIVVAPAPTTIVTAASGVGLAPTAPPQVIPLGSNFQDTATVTGVPFGPALTGNVIFRLYRVAGPGFPTCAAGELVNTSPPVPVGAQTPPFSAAPTAGTAVYAPPAQPVGNYVFVATYDEADTDVNYCGSTTACGDPLEQVVVQPPLPCIRVDKTANPTTVPEPGGTVTFTVPSSTPAPTTSPSRP